jgi:hypothetical protein
MSRGSAASETCKTNPIPGGGEWDETPGSAGRASIAQNKANFPWARISLKCIQKKGLWNATCIMPVRKTKPICPAGQIVAAERSMSLCGARLAAGLARLPAVPLAPKRQNRNGQLCRTKPICGRTECV